MHQDFLLLLNPFKSFTVINKKPIDRHSRYGNKHSIGESDAKKAIGAGHKFPYEVGVLYIFTAIPSWRNNDPYILIEIRF